MKSIRGGSAPNANFILTSAAALTSSSTVELDYTSLLKQIESSEKFVNEKFSVFMSGDKNAYQTDVRGEDSMRKALKGSNTTLYRQIGFLETRMIRAGLAQAYSVLRQLRSQLGHKDRFAILPPVHQKETVDAILKAGASNLTSSSKNEIQSTNSEGCADSAEFLLANVTLPDSLIPTITWRDCKNGSEFLTRCQNFLENNILTKDPGCKKQVKPEELERAETEETAHPEEAKTLQKEIISKDKLIRSNLIRNLQIALGYAQQVTLDATEELKAPLDENLITVLDLYGKAWCNLAATW